MSHDKENNRYHAMPVCKLEDFEITSTYSISYNVRLKGCQGWALDVFQHCLPIRSNGMGYRPYFYLSLISHPIP